MAVIRAVVGETPVCFAAKLTPAELGTANDVRQTLDVNGADTAVRRPQPNMITLRATGAVGQVDSTDVTGKDICQGLPLQMTERTTVNGNNYADINWLPTC